MPDQPEKELLVSLEEKYDNVYLLTQYDSLSVEKRRERT